MNVRGPGTPDEGAPAVRVSAHCSVALHLGLTRRGPTLAIGMTSQQNYIRVGADVATFVVISRGGWRPSV